MVRLGAVQVEFRGVRLRGFNSSMVRLGGVHAFIEEIKHQSFNSSMVRLGENITKNWYVG